MSEEKIIKKELLSSTGLLPGDLILTPKRLYFEYNAGFFKQKLKNLFNIPIDNIINVEASKNHLSSFYVLKIRYQDNGLEKEVKCSKSGWDPFKGRNAFKIEENLFNGWVKAIEEVRSGKYKQNAVSKLNELEKLAELKEKGVITEDEFKKKKKQILGL